MNKILINNLGANLIDFMNDHWDKTVTTTEITEIVTTITIITDVPKVTENQEAETTKKSFS